MLHDTSAATAETARDPPLHQEKLAIVLRLIGGKPLSAWATRGAAMAMTSSASVAATSVAAASVAAASVAATSVAATSIAATFTGSAAADSRLQAEGFGAHLHGRTPARGIRALVGIAVLAAVASLLHASRRLAR